MTHYVHKFICTNCSILWIEHYDAEVYGACPVCYRAFEASQVEYFDIKNEKYVLGMSSIAMPYQLICHSTDYRENVVDI